MEGDLNQPGGMKRPFYLRYEVIGAVLGAIGGYIYYWKIGCVSGTCPLTSNPWFTMAWGATLGYLLGDFFSTKPLRKKSPGPEDPSGL